MTQYAMPTIDPTVHTGTDLANFLNASYPALYSQHRGSSRPGYALPGMIWIDSSVAGTDSVRYYDGTNDILLYSFNTTTGEVVAGGPFTPGVMINRGSINPTIAAPASPRNGDQYFVGTAGAAHATFTGLSGTAMTVGDLIYYNGTNWQAIKLQSSVSGYLPLSGGTLTGSLSLSLSGVSQPFTALLPANVGSRFTLKNSSNGGAQFQGAAADGTGVLFHSYAGIPNTTNTTPGAFQFNVAKHNGSGGITALAANENAFSLSNNAGLPFFLIKADGSIITSGLISGLAVTQSQTDTTAGRLLKVGDAGILTNAAPIIESDAFPNYTAFFRNVTTGVLGPGLRGTLLNFGYDATVYTAQLLANRSAQNDLLFRTHNGTAWGAWNRLLHEGNSGSFGLVNGTSSVTIPTANNEIVATTAGVERLRITAGGAIATGGETAPDVDPGGLSINHGAGTARSFTIKSSSVAHPFSSLTEADTYASMRKGHASAGGLNLTGLASSAVPGVSITSYTQNGVTSGAGAGAILLNSFKSDGATSSASLAGNERLISIANAGTAVTHVLGNGNIFTTGGISTGGETAPDVDLGGLCLNQGGGDANILTLKSSDVAHPFSSVTETDTYFSAGKIGALIGGAFLRSYGTTNYSLYCRAYAVAPSTGNLSGAGVIHFDAIKTNGTTGGSALSETENILNVTNSGSARFSIKGSGLILGSSGLVLGGASVGGALVDPNALKIRQSTGISLITANSSTFTNPYTAYPTDQIWALQSVDPGLGGMGLFCASTDSAVSAFAGLFLCPGSSTTPAINLNVAKPNGSGGIADMVGNEIVFRVSSGVPLLTLRANKQMHIGGGLITGGGAINLLGLDAFGTYIRGQSSGNVLALGAGGINQPFAGMLGETTTFFNIPSNGGLKLTASASSGMSNRPLEIVAIGGGSASVANTAMVNQKHNGSGGVTNFASGEVLFAILNNNTSVFSVNGNGDVTVAGTITSAGGGGSSITNGTSSVSIPTANNEIRATTAGVERLRITAAGAIATGGETSPDVDAGGLCLNQGSNSGYIQTLKSSSVSHPFTATIAANTFGGISKRTGANGGLSIRGFASSSANGIFISSYTQAPSTDGCIVLHAVKSNGTTGASSLAGTDVLLNILNGAATVSRVMGFGDHISSGRFCGSVQLATPTTGTTVITNDPTQTLILNHTATIASLTIPFPTGRYDGQEFRIVSRSAITTVTLNVVGTVYGGITTLAANGSASYIYNSSNTSWYRLQ